MHLGLSVRWKRLSAAITIVALSLCISYFLSYAGTIFSKTNKRYAVLSSTSSVLDSKSRSFVCEQEKPCSYSDRVDLRIIVLTLNRPLSLLKLLESVDVVELDEQSAALEIWIDRNHKTNKVDVLTAKVAFEFQWSRGPTHVHVHTTHVGIHGQWIHTWRPHDDSDDELGLILEDDLSISKYAYRWVRAVFRAYTNRTDFVGASMTGYQCKTLSARRPFSLLTGPKSHTVFMYKGFSSWGFAPKPLHWRLFQNWYQTHKRADSVGFHPYIPETIVTAWYKKFERRGRTSTMWSIWFIYYMYANKLYSVYSNLGIYTGSNNVSLSINRFEVGLHVSRHRTANVNRLLSAWKYEYVMFPKDIARLNWDGSYVPSNRQY